jgi:hypothetical protein
MSKPSGVIFYEGPSELDGKPIVGIVTFDTHNDKVGNVVQTWIMRSDISPMDAVNTGQDSSVCGSCPLRGVIRDAQERTKSGPLAHSEFTNKNRTCYVLVHIAPQKIWESYKKGNYPVLNESHRRYFVGKGLRYGAYGEAVAIPKVKFSLMEKFCTGKAKPGYSHEWRNPSIQPWSRALMASVHTLSDAKEAQSKGWRTFRTIGSLDSKQDNEIICPASEEGGYKSNCAMCGACNGRRGMEDMRKNIVILGHGSGGKGNKIKSMDIA